MADPPPYPNSNDDTGDDTGTPRWVKVFGIISVVVVLLFVILLVAGGGRHGPGRHASSGGADGHTPSAQHP
jgi:hypothetical protein